MTTRTLVRELSFVQAVEELKQSDKRLFDAVETHDPAKIRNAAIDFAQKEGWARGAQKREKGNEILAALATPPTIRPTAKK